VVCVDPYNLARLGLAVLARRYPDLQLVGEAGTTEEARAVIARTQPDVVVIGDGLPEGGRGLVDELRAARSALGLVMVSHRTDDAQFSRARDAGISAFVSRTAPVTAVVAAIRHAAAAPGSFGTFGVPWTVERDAASPPSLSEREHQVLTLLRHGLSDQDIAASLQVGRGTVRTYITRLYGKLRVSNRSQAVLAAAGNQL
jgi:DNA-binding NarL/FixJ family response regulator